VIETKGMNMKLNRKESRIEWYCKSDIAQQIKNYTDKDNPTMDDCLIFLFGDQDGWIASDMKFYEYKKVKKTFMQRLNCFWVYPLFVVSIPIQYLFRGYVGVSRDSWLGKTVEFLTGEF